MSGAGPGVGGGDTHLLPRPASFPLTDKTARILGSVKLDLRISSPIFLVGVFSTNKPFPTLNSDGLNGGPSFAASANDPRPGDPLIPLCNHHPHTPPGLAPSCKAETRLGHRQTRSLASRLARTGHFLRAGLRAANASLRGSCDPQVYDGGEN